MFNNTLSWTTEFAIFKGQTGQPDSLAATYDSTQLLWLNVSTQTLKTRETYNNGYKLSDKKYQIELTMKRCSNLYEIRKMQIKVQHHFTSISVAEIRKLDNSSVGKDVNCY